MGTGIVRWKGQIAATVASVFGLFAIVEAQTIATFRAEQADAGEAAYGTSCVRCHGEHLSGTPLGPALLGSSFIEHWADKPLSDLFLFMKSSMPPGGLEVVSDSNYLAIIAYILEGYGIPASVDALPSAVDKMRNLLLPSKELLSANRSALGGGVSPDVTLPMWPTQQNPLLSISTVDDEVLATPPEGSWLTWRRTIDAAGFSPLKQITKDNVQGMRVAWTLALAAGPNEVTPLVHDGVIFLHSFGDSVQALNAATGEELWRYRRDLRVQGRVRKNIALYGDKLYLATSDSHVIALQIKSGRVAWDWFPQEAGMILTSAGAIVVDGVVVQGALAASGRFFSGLVLGLDAQTGKLLWRFNTVAQDGEINGNSWNGVPSSKRSGGGVWLPGSYDAKRKLVLLGPAPTYDTLPLRELGPDSGVTNDALYTNATIALDPKTGRLVWFYQHLPNDQWDLDWAFERQLIDLTIQGERRRVILTSGKEAVYDAIDADTGRYIFSMDLGLQNVITGIDPETGRKSVDHNLVPGVKDVVTICPHALGAKSWLPASYNAETQVLYVPLVEACMDMVRVARWGLLASTRWNLRPRPDSDGKYGRLQAINLGSRETVWMSRQRAPLTSGVLATAGGVVFAGALDRSFTAYDAESGKSLWRVVLSDVPNSSPITYLANGKQYVAVVVGHGGTQSVGFLPLLPEVRLPVGRSSAVWVFELPDPAR